MADTSTFAKPLPPSVNLRRTRRRTSVLDGIGGSLGIGQCFIGLASFFVWLFAGRIARLWRFNLG
jgi:hypothetical protein